MSHIDPEQLALLALGSQAPGAAEDAHLTACADCRDELGALQRAARTARATLDVGALTPPPERVWQRIQDEIDVVAPARSASHALRRDARPRSDPHRRRRRERWGSGWLVAAAVTAVSVVGAAAWAWSAALAPDVIAQADLTALPGHPGVEGSASIASGPDGSDVLSIDVAGLTAEAGSYPEVWLLSGSDASPVSLGRLDGTTGVFTIPAGVDLVAFPTVDVSLEPDDADPSHSGDSVARGRLSLG